MASYSGGCVCGAVRYEIEGDPVMSFQCQCRDCQRRSGGGHTSVMLFPAAAVRITGSVKHHVTTADSGRRMTRGFCPGCGSWLTGTPNPDLLGVTVGTLDDPGGFSPQVVIFNSRAQPWDMLDPALHRFPEMAPQ